MPPIMAARGKGAKESVRLTSRHLRSAPDPGAVQIPHTLLPGYQANSSAPSELRRVYNLYPGFRCRSICRGGLSSDAPLGA
jgi:hypothetical protein